MFVKQLPYNVTGQELYDLFGKFGAIRQIRLGNTPTTRGRAYVIYEDIFDAQRCVEKLNGYSFRGMYLVCAYHKPQRQKSSSSSSSSSSAGTSSGESSTQSEVAKSRELTAKGREELEQLKQKFGITTNI